MTTVATALHGIAPHSRDRTAQALRLWPVVAITVAAVLVMSLPNLADPFIRFDDYPALLAQPELFWGKTLHEGRWINYLWHLRGVVTPAWLNFAVYQVLWAVLAGALAVAAMGREGRAWYVAVLALFILVAPPATLISLWFNTLIPGLGIVALYAVLGCRLSIGTHRALLPVFVILSFWAYTTYPLILLAVCLVRTERHSLRDLIGLCVLFVVSFAAAILLTYTLNWQFHGVFGVPLDDWRQATPAADLSGMIANLPILAETLSFLMVKFSFMFTPAAYFHLAMLVGATLVLIRHAPREALYLHAGLWLGMALMVLQVLKLGVVAPSRSFLFVWIFYAVIVVRAAALLGRTPGLVDRMARNLTLLIVLSYMVQTFSQYTIYRPWQAETRAMAQVVETTDMPVLVYGDVMSLSGAKAVQLLSDKALVFRIEQITGRGIVLCDTDPNRCAAADQAAGTAVKVEVTTTGGQTRLSYPQGG
ncbi:hypothetical protein [Sulfitobacter sp. 20_GPM-1509m]|uniref:hypothetical protein n=1 Tax=Sulfitobacter sp. 20_GPM-1509m TaxID=1380367 RepID=UPI00068570B3|nr:hypothetical protein [Sulfitobacter sp. 20_GPM-1509m]